MPKENGIGFSEWTKEKQEIFRSLARINLMMWSAVLNKNGAYFRGNFTYFDITAGNGMHPEYGLGSPLIYIDELRDNFSKPWVVHLFELNYTNATQLEETVNKRYPPRTKDNVFIYNGDNAVLLDSWINKSKNKVPGLLYCDPTGEVPPFRLLSRFSCIWESIDLLVAFSATNKKRERCRFGRCELKEDISSIYKKNILIREPFGKHQWTFFYMTNGPLPVWERQGLHPLNSKRGQEIFNKLNYTNKERNDYHQPTLF